MTAQERLMDRVMKQEPAGSFLEIRSSGHSEKDIDQNAIWKNPAWDGLMV